jgi:hypothetical protein
MNFRHTTGFLKARKKRRLKHGTDKTLVDFKDNMGELRGIDWIHSAVVFHIKLTDFF